MTERDRFEIMRVVGTVIIGICTLGLMWVFAQH